MKIKLLGADFVIKFSHDRFDKWTEASLHRLFTVIEKDGSTREVVDDFSMFTAVAFCYYKDSFSRKTGRKMALAKLLEWMSKNRFMLSKEDRTKIWEQYFEEFSNNK